MARCVGRRCCLHCRRVRHKGKDGADAAARRQPAMGAAFSHHRGGTIAQLLHLRLVPQVLHSVAKGGLNLRPSARWASACKSPPASPPKRPPMPTSPGERRIVSPGEADVDCPGPEPISSPPRNRSNREKLRDVSALQSWRLESLLGRVGSTDKLWCEVSLHDSTVLIKAAASKIAMFELPILSEPCACGYVTSASWRPQQAT